MGTNLPEFRLQMRQGQDLLLTDWKTFYTRVFLEAMKRIVKRTAVDTGDTRGRWQASVGQPVEAESKMADPVSTGLAIVATGLEADPFATIWMTDNSPAILILEQGGFIPKNPGPSKDPRKGRKGRVLVKDGYSVQSPRGMVGVTFAELEGWVQA